MPMYGFSTFVYLMSNLYIRWDLHIFNCSWLYVLYFYDLFHILLSFWITSRSMEYKFICVYICNAQLWLLGMSCVKCWRFPNSSANVAVAIIRVIVEGLWSPYIDLPVGVESDVTGCSPLDSTPLNAHPRARQAAEQMQLWRPPGHSSPRKNNSLHQSHKVLLLFGMDGSEWGLLKEGNWYLD
jgi:hypothetical protein